MGHKVNPIGFRIGINRTWDSRWYANTREYGDLLHEDLKIRAYIKKECAQAGVSRVIIERPHRKCRVTIHTARPGVIIGKKGAVHADVQTVDAIIHGEYKGNMVATGSVEITPTGRTDGNIQTNSLVISKGGFFNGNVVKLQEAKEEKPPVQLVKEKQLAREG